MLVSVLMPTFNSGPYLLGAVNSVLNQSFDDFELIVIDDGSSDGSVEALEQIRDARLTLHRYPNAGLSPALNRGLALARGTLIARMDADDVAHPERIALQVKYLAAHPDVVLVGGQVRRFTETNVGRLSTLPRRHSRIVRGLLRGEHVLSHPATMYRLASARAVGGYWQDGVAEDSDFFLKMSEQGEVANLKELVLAYRFHNRSINSNAMLELRQNTLLAARRYKQRGDGKPESTRAEFIRELSWIGKLRIRAQVASLRYYRRSLLLRNTSRPILTMSTLAFAVLLWPSQALRRLLQAASRADDLEGWTPTGTTQGHADDE